MKKYLKYIIFVLFGLLVLFIIKSYQYNSLAYISNKTWKYSGGFPSGDFIEFKIDSSDSKKLKKTGADSAEIAFCFGKHLYVRNKESGKLGIYQLKTGFRGKRKGK
jgi:hypothetical protein